ncbi:SDR family NAD(P)-dependent oxidoreductase [Nocardia sp. 2YAB30]|uniref:SDR family NAD(P)-dependent oxidoreductase n=1 Tax=unclassified Nocardia TaxID=2637762 RepID=UPI003F9449C3
MVSLIEVLLAFQHSQIPPQHEFDKPPAEFEIAETNLEIPTAVRPWPAAKRPRTAAVSGFGFGGTNAHLIARDRAEADNVIGDRRCDEPIAIVAWSSALPGDPGQNEVTAWLRGAGRAPAAGYGDEYPLPSFREVRIPPATLRTIDRCQMMILQCVGKLAPELSDFWSAKRDTTGVFVGHLGPTRNGTLYASRCYLNHLRRVLAEQPEGVRTAEMQAAFESFEATVRSLVPPVNENSFPGLMPNVIPARVSNYYDFHGPNMTIDTGFPAGLTAVQQAVDSLRWGAVDLALACGVNGNNTPELHHILAPALAPEAEIAEGAFMVALARESTARAAGLPILGVIREGNGADGTEIRCDPRRADRSYLSGDGVKALIAAVTSQEPTVRVVVTDPLTGHSSQVTVGTAAVPETDLGTAAGPETDLGTAAGHETDLGTADREVDRHVVRLVPRPLEPVRTTAVHIDAGTLVITDSADHARGLLQRGAMVVCTDPDFGAADGVCMSGNLNETAFQQLPTGWLERIRHLRVVSTLPDPATGLAETTLGLHDATFLALKALHPRLEQREGSFAVLLLSAVRRGVPHPAGGLFTGLVKSMTVELAPVQCYTVLSSAERLDTGLEQLAAEPTARHMLPVVVYDGTTRQAYVPIPEPVSATEQVRLGRSSVVVAIGGGRGITAECAVAVAEKSSAKVWILGSNPLDTRPDGTVIDDGAASVPSRSEFIRDSLRSEPGVSVAELNTRYDRMAQARTVRANLARIAAHSGADRVRYLTCDVGDYDMVLRAISTIRDEDGRIDLMVNGAGLHRGGSLADKSLAEFRRIRDIRVRGYENLNRVFAEAGMPRPAIWCNFGSVVGFIGEAGEADYASSHEFLSLAASYSSSVHGHDEVTIGWTLWRDSGFVSDPVTAAFMMRAGTGTFMGSAEGRQHLLDELRLPRRYPSVVHLGAAELATLYARAPGLRNVAEPSVDSATRRQSFFLGRRLVDEPSRIVAERVLDLTTDSYLADHIVKGLPTLPGTFVTAIVADAALALSPDWKITAMSDLTFQKFLRVYPGGTGTEFRVVAEVVADAGGERVVTVRVVSDVRAPDGRILRRDQVHFQATAHLRRDLPPAPRAQQPQPVAEKAVVDPYHVSNDAVHLTCSLVSTRSTRVYTGGARAEFSLPPQRRHRAYDSFRVPAVLLDGLARVGVLTPGRYAPLFAPLSIARIDFYDDRNDVELADAFPGGLELYSSGGFEIDEADNGLVGKLSAVGADGRLILTMSQMRGIVFGRLDTETSEFLTAAQMKRRTGTGNGHDSLGTGTAAGNGSSGGHR